MIESMLSLSVSAIFLLSFACVPKTLVFPCCTLRFKRQGGNDTLPLARRGKKNSGLKQTLYPKRANASQQRGDRRKRAEQ